MAARSDDRVSLVRARVIDTFCLVYTPAHSFRKGSPVQKRSFETATFYGTPGLLADANANTIGEYKVPRSGHEKTEIETVTRFEFDRRFTVTSIASSRKIAMPETRSKKDAGRGAGTKGQASFYCSRCLIKIGPVRAFRIE